jgi:monoamine oxidase
VKRRKALKNIGLGVTAGLALPWLSSCTDDDTGPEIKYDGVVGIIGAGAAGLYAADYLIAKGVKVKIFEASNRIGGRVRSIKTSDPVFSNLVADFPLELGADRVIGSDSEWGNILKLLKVPRIDFKPTSVEKYLVDNQYKTEAQMASDSDYQALINFRDNILPGYTGGGSVESAAGLNPRINGILNSWLGNAYGSSSTRIGAEGLGEAIAAFQAQLDPPPHDGKELTLNINPMSDVLISRYARAAAKVQFHKAVEFVDYSGEVITLSVRKTQINMTTGVLEPTSEVSSEVVNKLIVAVPVSILKAGDIGFNPALPGTKSVAMSKIGMDASIRMIVEFVRNDIYGSNTNFIYGGIECPSHFMTGTGRSNPVTGNRTFSLTINGPKAEELSLLTDVEKVQHVLAELDAISPSLFATRDIRKNEADQIHPDFFVVQDWSKEPYIKGGQSYPMIGGTNNDRVDLAAPVGENLFFAGEATDITGEFGTISGALKSGRRAAEELVQSIVGA